MKQIERYIASIHYVVVLGRARKFPSLGLPNIRAYPNVKILGSGLEVWACRVSVSSFIAFLCNNFCRNSSFEIICFNFFPIYYYSNFFCQLWKIQHKMATKNSHLAEIMSLSDFQVDFFLFFCQILCFGSHRLELLAWAYWALDFSCFFGLGPDGLDFESSGFRA